ncbi:MAG: hypothetical protein LBI82_00885 [Dysgonamonadaceae bacterium]|jgi:hypothetical protein|nr:hypothetical protein [Dysgonamonadaceae bacterium]
MKKKIIYTDAPPEIEEAFARSKRIPNFIDVDSLMRKDGTKPACATKPKSRNSFKNVAAIL